MTIRPVLLLFALLAYSCHARTPVKTGADLLVEQRLDLLAGRRIGLITNHTGVLSSGTSLLDTLVALGMNVTAVFAPEHGIRGASPAGVRIRDTVDEKTGIPIFSLYTGTHKPTPAMLREVDVLLYDLQDVGARFYTYISTLKLAMEAAAEARLPFIVLDRPNPLGGMTVLGPVLEDSLRSFVGALPIPIVYGLTCGELAGMMNGERWLSGGVQVSLTVVRMEGWRRSMRWADTGLPWIPPSPNMLSAQTAEIYPGMCFVEATNLSEGRGTDSPFQRIGAPFVDGERVSGILSALPGDGARFSPCRFTPGASKYAGRLCNGVCIEVPDPRRADAVVTGIRLLQAFMRIHADSVKIDQKFLGRLVGSEVVVQGIVNAISPEVLREGWSHGLSAYREKASKYVIYTE